MSAQPTTTAPDLVTIEIDGTSMQVPKGSMIIQAADRQGIPIPRFCYHEKLSIAANCRMCLVDVEKSPKPMPACATPVMEGMKVYTQSKRALDAQRNVMEFLLINHPLDCPVCDQGGECELQDLSMGYGRSVSRFAERKRIVPDEDLGPLVATDMTRCIQCTRCIRVMGEIAGTYELGGMDRGENLQIGTYVGKPLESELSGNVIDVCPVGALTNKVYRFRARPWELIARDSIGYHDAVGGNLHLHLRRGEVMRAVPRDNDSINECWAADRDRWSHQALDHPDRLRTPMLREGDAWREASWDEALARAADILQDTPGEQLGMLVHPSTSNEEGALLAAIAEGLGCRNLDHRLRQSDFSAGPSGTFGMPVAEVGCADVIVLVGCDVRREAPLLGHRVRQAFRRGAKVFAINPVDFPMHLPLAGTLVVPPSQLPDVLLSLARGAADGSGATPPVGLAQAVSSAEARNDTAPIAEALRGAQSAVLVLGDIAAQHANAGWLRSIAAHIAATTGAAVNVLPAGANGIGLSAHGVLPHAGGLDAGAMLAQPRGSYLLYGCEPPLDFAAGATALKALSAAGNVVAFTAFRSPVLDAVATVLLPIGLLPEIDATLTNVDGTEQRVRAAARLPGAARPGWRVLRALGGHLGTAGFDFVELDQWRSGMQPRLPDGRPDGAAAPSGRGSAAAGSLERIATVPIYRSDAVVRRAAALQAHPLTTGPRLVLHPEDARERGLAEAAMARVGDASGNAVLPVVLDARVARGAAWIESCYDATAPLAGTALTVTGTSSR